MMHKARKAVILYGKDDVPPSAMVAQNPANVNARRIQKTARERQDPIWPRRYAKRTLHPVPPPMVRLFARRPGTACFAGGWPSGRKANGARKIPNKTIAKNWEIWYYYFALLYTLAGMCTQPETDITETGEKCESGSPARPKQATIPNLGRIDDGPLAQTSVYSVYLRHRAAFRPCYRGTDT